MTRAVFLVVHLLLLLWAFPAHAGHIIGVKTFTVSPDTAKVGDKIKVTLKGYINTKNYKCTLSASTTEGSVAAPAEIGSPNDASISVGTPYNFDVSFDVTFQKPHSPGDISVKLAQGTLEGQPLDTCDGISPSSQVWVMAADGKGKLTGLSFASPKVKVGDAVDFTVAGTGGLCNLNFQFVGGSWNGDKSGLETSLPFKSAKASFTKDGSAELTVTSLPSQTCEAGAVKTMVTVEKVAQAPPSGPQVRAADRLGAQARRSLVAPRTTMGIIGVLVSNQDSPKEKYSQGFDSPRQNTMVQVGYYTLSGGRYRLVVKCKNVGPGNSKPMTAGGTAAAGSRFMSLDPRPVPSLAPGKTQDLEWDLGLFQQAALTITLNLK